MKALAILPESDFRVALRDEIKARIHENARGIWYQTNEALRIPEKSDPAQWAERKRRLAQGESWLSKEGDVPFDFQHVPYCREPLESTVAPEVQTTVLMWASDLAKTSGVVTNVAGFCMDEEPSRIIGAFPVEKSAEAYSKEVLQPMITATPALRSRVHEAKSRDPGNTILHKIFPGGSVSIITAGSVSNFRQRRARCVFGEEIDAMPGSVGDEGDPIFLLFKRTEGYADSIQILSSTPTIKGRSRIEWWFLQSDKRYWFCPCRVCGELQALKWSMVDWPGDSFQKAVILCEQCGASHDDRQRHRMIRDGRWKPTAAFHGVRGYHLNGLYSLFPAKRGYRDKMHQFARDAHDAKNSQNKKETVRVWVNTFLAESFQEEQDRKQEWRKLFDRREDYVSTKLPAGVIVLVAGTDIQQDRIECEIVGFGRDEESWGIETGIFFGDPRLPEIWQRLEGFLSRAFVREDKARLYVKAAGIDTGYAAAQRMAYSWIRPRQRRNYFAFKGSSKIDADLVSRARSSKVDRVSLLMVGTHRIKDLIYDRALLDVPGVGYQHFPKAYGEEFFKQFLSENSYPEYKNGVRYRKFVHEKNEDGTKERNEKLDCRVYAHGALYALGVVNWDAEERRNLKTIPGEENKPAAQSGSRRSRGSSSNFWQW